MEQLVRWMWRRWQHRWMLAVAFAVASVYAFGLTAPALLVYASFFEVEARAVLALAAGLVPFLYVSIYLLLATGAPREFALLDSWVRGDRSQPLEIRAASMETARRLIGRAVPAACAVSVPLAFICADIANAGVTGAVAMTVGLMLIQGAGVVVTVVAADLLFRPLREEIDAVLPPDAPGPEAGARIRARLAASAMAVTWVCCMGTAAIVHQFDGRAAKFGVAALAALGLAVFTVFGLGGPTLLVPVFRPLQDLLRGTERVAGGVYDEPLPLTTNDEFGELVRSFNVMQQGLLERERLHSAFGSYVDPALAERLLAQGDDLFAGEEVTVTVFFADIRDFTPFAERSTPRQAVERLNDLFGLVVPVLHEHHGHANKFLGDGVLAVFGVPDATDRHADDAVAAAVEIQRQVAQRFGASLRVGIGINTGRVLAGTIGGGGKLEFTLIGDTVNVAHRVEEETKVSGDPILLTAATKDALRSQRADLLPRGDHELRGKSAPTALYALPCDESHRASPPS